MIQAELDLGKPLGEGDGQVMHSAGDENSAERKRARTTDEPCTVSLSDMFDEILQENNPFARQRTSSTVRCLSLRSPHSQEQLTLSSFGGPIKVAFPTWHRWHAGRLLVWEINLRFYLYFGKT